MTSLEDFTAREYKREFRCPGCKLTRSLCICSELPTVELPFELVIIQHSRERYRQSNSGGLLHRMVKGSRVVPYGARDHRFDPGKLWSNGVTYTVLFPLPGAEVVSTEILNRRPGTPSALVVIDATWGQAQRMSRRIPGIRRFPFVRLRGIKPAEPTLRVPPERGQRNTAAAVCGALRHLGLGETAATIEEPLLKFISRALHIRGKIPRWPVEESPAAQAP